MANQKIFCSVPWTNLHVYWDGSYGVCCSERQLAHNEPQVYNLKFMPVSEWYNSEPVKRVRSQIKQDTPLPMCEGCYFEERNGYENRRIRENFKTVIFTEQAFDRSYAQSTFIRDFERADNETDRLPVDWHIDFGNECNLACKMCNPKASSKISSHYKKWGMIDVTANNNWTLDEQSWENFKTSLIEAKNLHRIHFMGGEPLLNKKFMGLLDFLLEHKPKTSVSFVNNGTLITDELIEKLKKFPSCDVEVSIESVHENNSYIRQGSDTSLVLSNIQKLKAAADESESLNLVLRSVPQLLNINNYDKYIEYAWGNKLIIQGIPLINPRYLQIKVLPKSIREQLIPKYQRLVALFDEQKSFNTIVLGRNINGLAQQLRRECEAMISMLSEPEPNDVDALRKQLCEWLIRWDTAYKLDARQYYPEYTEFLDSIGYEV